MDETIPKKKDSIMNEKTYSTMRRRNRMSSIGEKIPIKKLKTGSQEDLSKIENTDSSEESNELSLNNNEEKKTENVEKVLNTTQSQTCLSPSFYEWSLWFCLFCYIFVILFIMNKNYEIF
tara:strand:+ start:1703 stop:2062 length:360 start_codon:yes stop_codon:yes gene_type:complete